MVQSVVKERKETYVYATFSGRRIRIVWNPSAQRWFAYFLDAEKEDDLQHPRFCVRQLELHTVGLCGEAKPKYALEGTPSFVGTVAAVPLMNGGDGIELISDPHNPARLRVKAGMGSFSFASRLLVDGARMFVKNPHK